MSRHTDKPLKICFDGFIRRTPWRTTLAVLFIAGLCPPLNADEIYFKSGYSRTAVILSETDETIKFKTEMGISSVNREKVDFVEKATPQENQFLLRKWREKEVQKEQAREAKREADRKFEETQKAKGFVQFEGRWVTPQEKSRILDLRNRAREDRRRFENEQISKGLVEFQNIWITPEQAAELRKMEPEVYRLYDLIVDQRRTLGALRSAMLNIASVEEAEEFSKRIEGTNTSIAENNDKLGKLLARADEIAATGARYALPDEFKDAFAQNAEAEQ